MTIELQGNAGLYIGGYNLSGVANSLSIEGDAEAFDVTTFGASYRAFLVGVKAARWAGGGFYDPVAADEVLNSKWGLVDQIVTMVSSNTAGAVAYSLRACEANYNAGMPVNGAATWQASGLTTTPPLARGHVLYRATALTVTASSTAQQLGAVSASQSIYASLHVFTAGGTPTLDVVVESDDDSGFATPVTRLTFAQKTTIGAEWQSAAGAITDDWWRITATVGGSTPSLGFIVTLAIQ